MKRYNCYTSSMRHLRLINKSILSNNNENATVSTLKVILSKNSGKNNTGHTCVYTKSKSHKRYYRYIDYKRNLCNVPGIIYTHEYDPNRSSFISLILFKNNICCYIISVNGLNIGDQIQSYKDHFTYDRSYNKGDNNQLLYLPISSLIHCLELWPNKGGIYIRSAGVYGKILKKITHINKVLIELPSDSLFYASIFSKATIGVCGNMNHNRIILGKAGRNRWLGYKPIVRGVAMNPIDHPHGGGEGKRSSDSLKKSPWGRILKWNNKRKIKLMDMI